MEGFWLFLGQLENIWFLTGWTNESRQDEVLDAHGVVSFQTLRAHFTLTEARGAELNKGRRHYGRRVRPCVEKWSMPSTHYKKYGHWKSLKRNTGSLRTIHPHAHGKRHSTTVTNSGKLKLNLKKKSTL